MINEIAFTKFRAIERAALPLGPLNLLVGPNGTGKTTVLEAVRFIRNQGTFADYLTLGAQLSELELRAKLEISNRKFQWTAKGNGGGLIGLDNRPMGPADTIAYDQWRGRIRHYAFDASKMRAPVTIQPHQELNETGANLAGFLDFLRDNGSANFEALEHAMSRCLPEFDEIGFDRPSNGHKALKLHRRGRNDFIAAGNLSEGTLYTLALLAMAFQPFMPAVVCIEEPDRGIHPRLFREVYDALCRLSFPDRKEATHQPIQVIVTTHSPHFLNQFTEHPERVIVCERKPQEGVTFRNLGSDPAAREILEDSLIGDAWYAGALGGVPANN